MALNAMSELPGSHFGENFKFASALKTVFSSRIQREY
jgi:hypothetical protein